MRTAKPHPLTAIAVGLAAMFTAHTACAQTRSVSTTVQTTTQITEPASIDLIQNLSFNILPQTLNSGLVISSSAVGGVNANILLRGAIGDTVSVSIPTLITVIRDGGLDSVTIRTVGGVTNVNLPGAGTVTGVASGSLFNMPVTVTGNLDGGVLSFSVGGQVVVANTLAPGEYHGVLTVVAQYN